MFDHGASNALPVPTHDPTVSPCATGAVCPRQSYAEVPYPRVAHRDAHVRRMQTIARLFGMQPAPIDACRVLEIGCAAGWNLIPQAFDFSNSQFLGIDLSAEQVADGNSLLAQIGLTNIQLRAADVLEVDATWGPFDYIICHGVYSWVPARVQDKILRVCAENLTPQGVALVSYNTYPGWHSHRLVRDLMLYHIATRDEPAERLSKAREILAFVTENCHADPAYAQALTQQQQRLQTADDRYLYHDHLERDNHPVYVHQFVRQVQSHGLQYLGDSDLGNMLPDLLPSPAARERLSSLPLVEQLQYLDFLRNTSFRSSLLCRGGVPLSRNVRTSTLSQFHYSLSGCPEPVRSELSGTQPVEITIGDAQGRVTDPLAQVMIHCLSDSWPESVAMAELCERIARYLSGHSDHPLARGEVRLAELHAAIVSALAMGVVELSVHPPRTTNRISQRFEVSPWVRVQADAGNEVTNQRHEMLRLAELPRFLVRFLDGVHDRGALIDRVLEALGTGILSLSAESGEAGSRQSLVARQVDAVLEKFRQAALLMP